MVLLKAPGCDPIPPSGNAGPAPIFVERWFVMTTPVLPLLEVYFVSSGEIISQGWEGELWTGRTVEKQRIRHVMGEDALKKKTEK